MTELNPDLFMKKDEESEARGAECRNLLSVAYKNMVGSRRTALRILANIEESKESGSNERKSVQEYMKTIQEELKGGCNEIIVSEGGHFETK